VTDLADALGRRIDSGEHRVGGEGVSVKARMDCPSTAYNGRRAGAADTARHGGSGALGEGKPFVPLIMPTRHRVNTTGSRHKILRRREKIGSQGPGRWCPQGGDAIVV